MYLPGPPPRVLVPFRGPYLQKKCLSTQVKMSVNSLVPVDQPQTTPVPFRPLHFKTLIIPWLLEWRHLYNYSSLSGYQDQRMLTLRVSKWNTPRLKHFLQPIDHVSEFKSLFGHFTKVWLRSRTPPKRSPYKTSRFSPRLYVGWWRSRFRPQNLSYRLYPIQVVSVPEEDSICSTRRPILHNPVSNEGEDN